MRWRFNSLNITVVHDQRNARGKWRHIFPFHSKKWLFFKYTSETALSIIIIIIIIIIILLSWEFFTPELADSFPLESEWQYYNLIFSFIFSLYLRPWAMEVSD